MQDFTQDRLIQSENLTEFNIAYPIYITGWEVRQVQDINKLYARVFYKKSVRGAKAAKVKLTCISEFGEIIQEEIKSINDIDKRAYDFFEIYPLCNDTRKIQVSVVQGLSSDGTSVAETQDIMVSNTFVPFGQEIESAAGQRLVVSAKGYPIEMKICWICCCGALNTKDSDNCVQCNSEKATVFEKIAEVNIKGQIPYILVEREKQKQQEEKERKKYLQIKRSFVLSCISFCISLCLIPLLLDTICMALGIYNTVFVNILLIFGLLLGAICICLNILNLKNYTIEDKNKRIVSIVFIVLFSIFIILFILGILNI